MKLRGSKLVKADGKARSPQGDAEVLRTARGTKRSRNNQNSLLRSCLISYGIFCVGSSKFGSLIYSNSVTWPPNTYMVSQKWKAFFIEEDLPDFL